MIVLVLLVISSSAACLNATRRDQRSEAVARAPERVVGLPLRSSRPYWLLFQEPGWAGSHEARFGGEQRDAGLVVIRIARFDSESAAAVASEQLTPAYLFLLAKPRIAAPPEPGPDPAGSEGHTIHRSIAQRITGHAESGPPGHSTFITMQSGQLVALIECACEDDGPVSAVVDTLLEMIGSAGAP